MNTRLISKLYIMFLIICIFDPVLYCIDPVAIDRIAETKIFWLFLFCFSSLDCAGSLYVTKGLHVFLRLFHIQNNTTSLATSEKAA